VLHSTQIKERLEKFEDDPLLEHVSRQLGETLVGTNLLLSKMRKAKELASQEVLQATKLKFRVTGLTLDVEELRKADRETKGLLFEKSQETLRLYSRNGDLRTEVDGLKKELANRDEEMVRKDELFQQTKNELTSDVVDSYATGFEDAMA